ncbi:MAG TPA: GAF domain-containing protein [Solirubrobacterales bacterium]|jgi:signal transduction histidine kinase|nr:GAF domain-containing protein [Solirubrobacterales bacterium]
METPNRASGGAGEDRSRRLIDVGTGLLSELDLESVLRSVVEAARELTGAEYAALGVLDRERKELERFINLGIDDEARRDIGNLPRGRGVLGELIANPEPLRLRDVNQHPHAYGFPPGHPPMRSFLGVPISIRGEVYGNLYMTEKKGADEFDGEDEEAALTLAVWAGIAIENARLYTTLSEREAEIEQALHRAETAVDIARAVGGETDVERVLDLIVKRARALVEAKTLLVLLRKGGRLKVVAQAGHIGPEVEKLTIPVEDSVFQAAMQERVAQHLERGSSPSEARVRERLGAEAALVVPLLFRERAVGVLLALDREAGGSEFDEEDLRLLQAFAASAATAVATAQAVESDLLQQQVEAGEQERQRWARELHDETLQSLAAIRITLATALQSDAPDRAEKIAVSAEQTVDRLEGQINELSRLINDLRPASLERLGLSGALEALVEECGSRGGFDATAEIELDAELTGEEERVVYRLAQEALNNVVKHSSARRACLRASLVDGALCVVIEDDGSGFDSSLANGGRGLVGMRERVALLGGRLEVSSEPERGTRITASLPVRSA